RPHSSFRAEQLDHLSRRDGGSFRFVDERRRCFGTAHGALLATQRCEATGRPARTAWTMRRHAGRSRTQWRRRMDNGLTKPSCHVGVVPTKYFTRAGCCGSQRRSGRKFHRSRLSNLPGAYGLAVRVLRPPAPQQQQQAAAAAVALDPRRIRATVSCATFSLRCRPAAGGVRIRGCSNEPVFRSLSELVQCHSLTLAGAGPAV
uniref:SRCR domain-containing protein n=1 Tax=Macrostomum lignano TaxID=282301 RepID=A0A1I8F4K6_9PLAT